MQAVLVVYRVVCRYFGFTADWENWGENDRMLEGWGVRGGERKIGFFFPLPLPLPQFFYLSPTLGKLFTSPQLSTISRWRPEQPIEIYIHSPHQNPPALQAINYLVHPTQSKSRKISYGEEVHWWRLKTNNEIKWSNNNLYNIFTLQTVDLYWLFIVLR